MRPRLKQHRRSPRLKQHRRSPRLKHPRQSPRLKQYHPKVPLSETQSGSFKRDALKERVTRMLFQCVPA